jgi:hypothetical protein
VFVLGTLHNGDGKGRPSTYPEVGVELVPELDLVDEVGDAVTRGRVLDDGLEAREDASNRCGRQLRWSR